MIAVLWALCSMLCGALNDFAFKLFTRRGGSVGIYVTLIGLVWILIFFFAATGGSLSWPQTGGTHFWPYALVSGTFSALANILLIESMRRQEVGICAAVYRLNLVPAALVGMLWLGEGMALLKWIGVALAAGSVLAFLRADILRQAELRANEGGAGGRTPDGAAASLANPERVSAVGRYAVGRALHKMAFSAFMLLVLAALLRAAMGITYKLGMNAGAALYPFLMVNGWMWAVCGVVYHRLTRSAGGGRWRWSTLGYGLLSGVLISALVLFLALALRHGEASVVLPIAQLSFILTALLGVLLLGESLGRFKVLGLFLAVCSILCMVLVIPS